MARARQDFGIKPLEEATVRVGTALAIPEVLRSLRANPAAVLAKAGLSLDLFDDPNRLMSFKDRSRLVTVCVDTTGCRHFGLLVGQRTHLASLGLVGQFVKYAPDVGTALRSLVRYFHIHGQGGLPDLAVERDQASFSFAVYQPRPEAVDQLGDAFLALALNIMRELCGADWQPSEVDFVHRRPADVAPFRRLFRVPLRFDADQYALVFPTDTLKHRITEANADIHRLLQPQIDALDAAFRGNFPAQVRRILRTGLLTNRARADQVAALFSMHRRTMNRHLNGFGTTFQELVDEGRFEIARQMLEDSRSRVNEIAAALDYHDASAFTRAFRRWSGKTPEVWRAESRSRGAPGTTAGTRAQRAGKRAG